jgi:hypothetical protein
MAAGDGAGGNRAGGGAIGEQGAGLERFVVGLVGHVVALAAGEQEEGEQEEQATGGMTTAGHGMEV